MGCGSSNLGIITDDDINPPIPKDLDNEREKKDKEITSGEIYYIRGPEAIKRGAFDPSSPNYETEYMDKLQIRITICYVFKKNEMENREKLLGTKVKFYHSHLIKEKQLSYVDLTEEFTTDHFNERTIKDNRPLTKTPERTVKKYEYIQSFDVEYCFQKNQIIKFEIAMKTNTQVVDTTLGEILGSQKLIIELPFFFEGTLDNVALLLHGQVIKDEFKSSIVTFALYTYFDDLPFSDYYVIISNTKKSGERRQIWKSEDQSGNSFVFIASNVTVQDLCFGDKNSDIIFDFYSIYRGQVGYATSTLNLLIQKNFGKGTIPIYEYKEEKDGSESSSNDDKKNKNTKKQIGHFTIKLLIENVKRFIDLIEKGLQISLIFGIDFTKSNGDPTDPYSRHYINEDPKILNEYEMSIKYCGGIIAKYDFDKCFPVLGFGAGVPPSDISHCFNVNLTSDPYVNGIDNVLNIYRNNVKLLRFDGPTYFSPILNETVRLIKDGIIHDFEETKATIIKASYLPFSVIIIGIGDEDFSAMDELDGDDNILTDKNGNKALRDCVQFVNLNEFENKTPDNLSKKVLEEIPSQIEEYYRKFKFVGLEDVEQGDNNTKDGTNIESEHNDFSEEL